LRREGQILGRTKRQGRPRDKAGQSKTAGENRNKELIERFYHEMWNRFDKAFIPVLLGLTRTFVSPGAK
jgi:hypothetical protein